MTVKLPYFNNCVNWDEDDVDALTEMIDASLKITRRTFLQHVNWDDMRRLSRHLSYGPDLPMSRDWAVQYFRSKLHGERVYFFTWSAIEYVFAAPTGTT